jgi:hypothetical protein
MEVRATDAVAKAMLWVARLSMMSETPGKRASYAARFSTFL